MDVRSRVTDATSGRIRISAIGRSTFTAGDVDPLGNFVHKSSGLFSSLHFSPFRQSITRRAALFLSLAHTQRGEVEERDGRAPGMTSITGAFFVCLDQSASFGPSRNVCCDREKINLFFFYFFKSLSFVRAKDCGDVAPMTHNDACNFNDLFPSCEDDAILRG